ncbi:hypothetical protein C1H46_019323 [Malus baccata]|uniref:Uncharacterized protein n=1 Tax=Malus baccata TaxID=106549 RepID=A0A540M8J7_MALBA|nr:hypothetical protein C1H46_019323 [Malus baccata]
MRPGKNGGPAALPKQKRSKNGAVSTGEADALADGPLYLLFTGRRDSTRSYHDEAMAEILKPDDEITLTLDLFSLSGFKDKKLSSLPGSFLEQHRSFNWLAGQLCY